MTETAADEQDLAKALDSVANAASSLDGTSTVQPSSSSSSGLGDLPPIIPPNSPIAPAASTPALPTYPAITPIHDSNDRPDEQQTPTISVTPTPVLPSPSDSSSPASTDDIVNPLVDPVPAAPDASADVSDAPIVPPADDVVVESGPLADIKNDALNELRPLVDKLDVTPEEKFDTYLLLIRSTDDTNLVGPAHEAAKSITDEAKRAEALLEIIKEIDYLSRKK